VGETGSSIAECVDSGADAEAAALRVGNETACLGRSVCGRTFACNETSAGSGEDEDDDEGKEAEKGRMRELKQTRSSSKQV